MRADLYCGSCESSMMLDNSPKAGGSAEIPDSSLWYLLLRFSNAHVGCRYVSPAEPESVSAGDDGDTDTEES